MKEKNVAVSFVHRLKQNNTATGLSIVFLH